MTQTTDSGCPSQLSGGLANPYCTVRPYSVRCILIEIKVNKNRIPTKPEPPTVIENGPQRFGIKFVLFRAENTKQIKEITKPISDNAMEHSLLNLSETLPSPLNALGVSRIHEAQMETQKKEKAGNSREIAGAGFEKTIINIQIRTGINVKRISYDDQITERTTVPNLFPFT
ncbi:MAG: hypothetical protein ACRBB4_13260 [Neptuniibacter sp.]